MNHPLLIALRTCAWISLAVVLGEGPGAGQATLAGEVDTVVVCRKSWQAELAPWRALRQGQGHQIAIIEPEPQASLLRTQLQKWYSLGTLRHIVLMGDTSGSNGIPTGQTSTTASADFGAPPEFPSDFLYSDLDEDGVPDVTLGRISVERRDQLQQILARIIRYESSVSAGPWQQRVEVVGGIGGFGPLIDGAVERAVQTLLVNGIPTPYRTGLVYANWKSPYCPAIHHFQDVMLQRYNSGCLLWVYAGHGHTQMLDRVGSAPLLRNHEVHRLQPQPSPPIAALLSCNAGNFHAEQECLAEAMARAPGGPIAILAGTSVSMPYGSLALADAMLRSTFSDSKFTLGESLLAAQRELLDPDAPRRRWIDQIAGLLGTDADARQTERLEHVHMFHLLGDPLLRLPLPGTATLTAPSTAQAGESIRVQLDTPLAGHGRLELACQRGRLRFASRTRSDHELQSAGGQHAWDQEQQEANADTWCHAYHTFAAGASEIELAIPKEAHGHCYLRVFIANETRSALGAAPVYIRNGEPAPQSISP